MLVRPLWAVSEHGCCAIVIVYDSNECRESGLSQLDRRVLSACQVLCRDEQVGERVCWVGHSVATCGVMRPVIRVLSAVVALKVQMSPDPTYTTFMIDGLTGAADEADLATFKPLCVRERKIH